MQRPSPQKQFSSWKFWLLICLWVTVASGFPLQAAETNVYAGGVGAQPAVFTLTWHDDGTISGIYYCPGGSGKVYALRGSNPREGGIVLKEYTNGQATATCVLTKSLEKGKIVWRGVMCNHDGRNKGMFFYRGQ